MAIKMECPRCKTILQVPNKLMGQYTTCPACQTRFLIPLQALSGAADESLGNSGSFVRQVLPVGVAVPSAPPGAASSVSPAAQAAAAPIAGSSWLPSAAPVPQPAAAAQPAHANPPARKVARFVTAEEAQSNLHLAADGQLPTLQLTEGGKSAGSADKGKGMNPLAKLALISLGMVLWALLFLFLMFDTSGDADQLGKQWRGEVRTYYEVVDPATGQLKPLQPYQAELRDAQLAHVRGDAKGEREHYQKVLHLLRSEGRHDETLTGKPSRDKNLERLLSKLLELDSGVAPEEP